jgi:hypothetical protein
MPQPRFADTGIALLLRRSLGGRGRESDADQLDHQRDKKWAKLSRQW